MVVFAGCSLLDVENLMSGYSTSSPILPVHRYLESLVSRSALRIEADHGNYLSPVKSVQVVNSCSGA